MKTTSAFLFLLAVPAALACPRRPQATTTTPEPASTATPSSISSAVSSSVSSAVSSAVSSPVSSAVSSSVSSTVSSAVSSPVSSAVPSSSASSLSSSPASSSASSVPTALPVAESSSAVTGSSTFYGGNLNGGTCSFTGYSLPSGIYGTAFSGSAWDSAAHCGACLDVTANGKTITVMIVDQCPECDEGHLDLFQDAFEVFADASVGIIDTSYTFVDCPISSPLVLRNKSGTSPFWFSMQVVNANEAVSKLEVSTDGGSTWQSTERQDYNFFEKSSGFGTDTVTIRVTGESGSTVTVEDMSVASDSQVTAASNF